MSLADGFHQWALRAPMHSAFVIDDRRLTYRELECYAMEWRHYLGLKVNHGDRLGWYGQNDPALAALYLASTQLCCAVVLLDSTWPGAMLQRMCRRHSINEMYSETELPDFSVGGVTSPSTPQLVQPDPDVDLHQGYDCAPFLIGHTSGSSGAAKAFVRNQQSWKSTFIHAAVEFANAAAGTVLAPGPLSHGLSFYAMAETLNAGGTFYTQKKFNPQTCLDLIADGCISSVVLVPTMLRSMIQVANADETAGVNRPPGALVRIICAGAKLSASLRADAQALFPNAEISEYYGASELSFVSVSHGSENTPPASVGRAFKGVSLSIRDDAGLELPIGRVGKIYVESDMLAGGYINATGCLSPLDEMEGAATVSDMGYLDASGYLFLTDRADSMLISGGLNIFPGEIEQVLSEHPSITDCIVIGVPDEYWGDSVIAVVRIRAWPDTVNSVHAAPSSPPVSPPVSPSVSPPVLPPNDQSLKFYCRRQLPAYMVPRGFFAIVSWPLTSSGKINRLVVRDSCIKMLSGADTGEGSLALERIDA